MRARNAVLTLELEPGRDYHVIRGTPYENHEDASCAQCQDHPRSYDPEWPKLHTVGPYLCGAPIELHLAPTPVVHALPQAMMPARRHSPAMGGWLDDIWDFIKSIIDAILNFIGQLIARIIHDLLHPLDLLKDLVQFVADAMTGALFLKLLNAFPLTHWIYQGLNWLTGGFLDNLTLTLSLPGMFFSGQHITRADLMKALSICIMAVGVALAFFTGGATLAIIGLSITLLKNGPIGKTALGRTILDIAGIGLDALCGGGDLVDAFVNAGMSKLEGTAVGELAQKLHLSPVIVGLVEAGVGAVTGGGDDGESGDETDTSDMTDTSDTSSDTSSEEEPAAATSDEEAPSDSESPSETSAPSEEEAPAAEEATPESTDTSSDEIAADASSEEAAPGDETSSEEDQTSSDEEDNTDEEDTSSDETDNSGVIDALKATQLLLQATQAATRPTKTTTTHIVTTQSSASHTAKPKSSTKKKKGGLLTALTSSSGANGAGATTSQTAQAQKKALLVAGVGAVALLALLQKGK